MLLLKLIAPLLLLLGVVAQYVADDVWHDKRTKRHRRVRTALLILQLAAGIGTVTVVVREHEVSQDNRVALQRIGEEAKANADASAARDATSQTELLALRNQVGDLNGRLEPFVRTATQKYPRLPEASALERLTVDLANVQSRTSLLERRVYSVLTAVELVLQGDWDDGLSRGPERPVIMPRDDPYVRFIRAGADRDKDIACYPTSIARRREGRDLVVVNVEASVRPGGWPLGQTVDQLRDYRSAEIAVAMVERRIAKSPNVILKEARLKIFINGILEVSRDDHPSAVIELPVVGIRVLTMSGIDLLAEVSKMAR